MKIGLPVKESARFGQRISPHFGHAPSVLLVNEEDGNRALVPNRSERRGEGTCGAVDVMIGFNVNVVICRQLGRGALFRLNTAGISVYRTPHLSVEKSLKAWEANRLETFSEAHVCNHATHQH